MSKSERTMKKIKTCNTTDSACLVKITAVWLLYTQSGLYEMLARKQQIMDPKWGQPWKHKVCVTENEIQDFINESCVIKEGFLVFVFHVLLHCWCHPKIGDSN